MNGSHCIPVSYEYKNGNLSKKLLPEGRYLEIDYDELNRVKTLKEPPTSYEEPETVYLFEYGNGTTDVFNGLKIKTKYVYENGFLIAIEEYNKNNELYRETRKYWKENKLKALTLSNGTRNVYSLQYFDYDKFGNLKSEILYGNLTGEKEIIVQVDKTGKVINPNQVEKHVRNYVYSEDGLNLLSEIEDIKNVSIQFKYEPGTNRLIKKFIQKNGWNLKRTFYSYNSDGICTKITEDDGSEENENDLSDVTERHEIYFTPKQTLPGLGLPESVEIKAYDHKNKKKILDSVVTRSPPREQCT